MRVIEKYPGGHRTIDVNSVIDNNGNRVSEETQIEVLDNDLNPTSLELIQAREIQTQVNPENVQKVEMMRSGLSQELGIRREARIESARQTEYEYFG